MIPRASRQVRSGESGFTLVELLVVVAVAALLLGLALPRYNTLALSMRLQNMTYQFAADVRYAQEVAQRDWTRSRVLFGAGYYEVQVGTVQNPDPTCTVPSTDYTTLKHVALEDVTLQRRFWPDTCIVFERTGRIPWATPSLLFLTPNMQGGVDTAGLKQAVLLDNDRFNDEGKQASVSNLSTLPLVLWQTVPKANVIINLGKPQIIDTVCIGVVNFFPNRSDFKYPQQLALYWAAATPPEADPLMGVTWNPIGTVTPTQQQSPWRNCPSFNDVSYKAAGWDGVQPTKPAPAPVQYIRFELTRSSPKMGIDEIEVQPTIVFSSTSSNVSRKVTIIPATGSVTLSK